MAKYDKMDPIVESLIETFFNDQMIGANVILPKDVIIEVLHKVNSAEITSHDTFCRYLDAKFHISIIGNTASMDNVKSGISFDSGTVTQRVRFDILWSDVRWFETWLNEVIIYPQVSINYPNIKPGDVYIDIMIGKNIDADVFRNVVTDLHNIGVDLPKNHTLEQFGIPGVKNGEEIIPGKSQEAIEPSRQIFSDLNLDENQLNYLKKLEESIKK